MADNTEKISSFCTITGASAEQSKFFLEAASWDLDVRCVIIQSAVLFREMPSFS